MIALALRGICSRISYVHQRVIASVSALTAEHAVVTVGGQIHKVKPQPKALGQFILSTNQFGPAIQFVCLLKDQG